MIDESQTIEICYLLKLVVRAMVDNKAAVSVAPLSFRDGATAIEIRVANGSDFGRVVGKQGRVARSLRIVFRSIAKQYGGFKEFRLNIVHL